MNWVKHIVVALAAVLVAAGPALSCCFPGHGPGVAEAASAVGVSQHHTTGISTDAQPPCHGMGGDTQHAPSLTDPIKGDPAHDDQPCPGCDDCAAMTAQKQAHAVAVTTEHDITPETVAVLSVTPDQSSLPTLVRGYRPPSTAPPCVRTPVALKQILII